MSAFHALGAEQGAISKNIVEEIILTAVATELTTSQAFNPERINQLLFSLMQDPDMKNVLNVQATLGNMRVRASLLTQEESTTLFLNEEDLDQIDTIGYKIDTKEDQDATAIVVKYTIQPKKLVPPQYDSQSSLTLEEINPEVWRMLISSKVDYTIEEVRPELDYEDALNNGKFPWDLWRMFISNNIVLSPDATVKVDADNNRWQITDTVNSNVYNLWQEDNSYWIHIGPTNTGYIRVLFDVPYIEKSIRSSMLMHAIVIVIVGALLVVIFSLMTNYWIMKPLAQMTEIIQNAETGNFSSFIPRRYASDEIGKATRNLVNMFIQLNTSHSRKIAALGQFAAGVAHEIRNPLNSIGMTAQHLKNIFSQPEISPEDIEEAKEFLDIVDDKIRELKQTSDQFLTLNRPQKLNLKPVNLNTLIDTVLSEFVLITEEAKIQIISNYDSKLPNMLLDKILTRQTIFNFVQNSIQAMPKGGSIYITTTMVEIRSVSFVNLEIRDTGIGIPEENQERIYDAYFTTKDTDGGVGLGLAISHQIISAHQGKVEVRSKVGMGTVFKIILPIKRAIKSTVETKSRT